MSRLTAAADSVSVLNRSEVDRMHQLLCECFENVSRDLFLRDLAEKDFVITVRDLDSRIQGFSTLKFYAEQFSGQLHQIAFSGDTIISPAYWGSLEMPVMIGVKIFQLYKRNPEIPLWWLLISKGIRTFKCMPAFFERYYPNPETPAPPEIAGLMKQLGRNKFGSSFDPLRGVINPTAESYFLQPSLAAPDQRKEPDAAARFFYTANPDYSRGAELLCLGRFHPENLKPLILRLILARDQAAAGNQRLHAA